MYRSKSHKPPLIFIVFTIFTILFLIFYPDAAHSSEDDNWPCTFCGEIYSGQNEYICNTSTTPSDFTIPPFTPYYICSYCNMEIPVDMQHDCPQSCYTNCSICNTTYLEENGHTCINSPLPPYTSRTDNSSGDSSKNMAIDINNVSTPQQNASLYNYTEPGVTNPQKVIGSPTVFIDYVTTKTYSIISGNPTFSIISFSVLPISIPIFFFYIKKKR